MNRRETRTKRRRFVRSVEVLDDRVVLSASAAAAIGTPAPAGSPFGVAHLGKFEHDLARVDAGHGVRAKHPKSYVVDRTVYVQNVIAKVATRGNVPSLNVSGRSTASSSSGQGGHKKTPNSQVDQLVASFGSNPVATSGSQPGVPANAIESNLAQVRAGASSGGNSSASSVQIQTVVVSSPVSNGSASTSNASSSTSALASTSASASTSAGTSTTGTNVIGAIGTQVFSNAFTQDGSPITTTFNNVGVSLERIDGAIGSTSTTPTGAFEPTTRFASGNGVTFSGT